MPTPDNILVKLAFYLNLREPIYLYLTTGTDPFVVCASLQKIYIVESTPGVNPKFVR